MLKSSINIYLYFAIETDVFNNFLVCFIVQGSYLFNVSKKDTRVMFLDIAQSCLLLS